LLVYILEFCGAKLRFETSASVFMERGGAASKNASAEHIDLFSGIKSAPPSDYRDTH
jgi:hypothetical protein